MCGIFGYVNYGNRLSESSTSAIYDAFARKCVARGVHASGVAFFDRGLLCAEKAPVDLVAAKFDIPNTASVLTAHCRLSLQKNYLDNRNNHPFCGKTLDGLSYAIEHNGILRDLRDIRKTLNIPSTEISTDSYLIAQILDTKPRLDIRVLKEVCEQLRGSFAFTIASEDGSLYICRGDVPIYLVHFKALKLYLYISTRDLFEEALKNTDLWYDYKSTNLDVEGSTINIVPLGKGNIVKIATDGTLERDTFAFQEDTAISHNWYMHEITETEELKAQLANLNNT